MEKFINEGGINGLGTGLVNTNSNDFKLLQQKIIQTAQQRSSYQKMDDNLFSIKRQMLAYFNQQQPEETIAVGYFLNRLVKVLKIKNKTFAAYIEYNESNLSALYKGRRKINSDLAIKLGHIFNIAPDLWLNIQNKNELLLLKKAHKTKYAKYKLEDLIST